MSAYLQTDALNINTHRTFVLEILKQMQMITKISLQFFILIQHDVE